jgi:hypothetical protein
MSKQKLELTWVGKGVRPRLEPRILNVHVPPPVGAGIGHYVYGHFKRCLYPITKFQSNPERLLAGILENDWEKWFRPARGQFQMEYRVGPDPQEYQPNFVADRVAMLNVKAENELESPRCRRRRGWRGNGAFAPPHTPMHTVESPGGTT